MGSDIDSDFKEPVDAAPPLEPEKLALDLQVKKALQERLNKKGTLTTADIDYIVKKFG